jgi:hypothetical protein
VSEIKVFLLDRVITTMVWEAALRIFPCLIVFIAFLLTSGCQSSAIGTVIPSEDVPSQTDESALPDEGDTTMTPILPTPAAAGLQNLIEKAKVDLVQRLSASTEDIILLEARSVTWPDASLGCPQEGMAYAQVLTPGYLIRLQVGDQEFEYHASRGTEVVHCEYPMPPVEGTPGDV